MVTCQTHVTEDQHRTFRVTNDHRITASSHHLVSLTLSSTPLIAFATFSPRLPSQMHESSMTPRYPATRAFSRVCILLYAANRSSLLDMALCTMANVTSFSLRSQFDTRPLQQPSQAFMAARSDAVPCESDESPDWPYLVCVECGDHDNDEDGDASLAPSIPRGKTTCDEETRTRPRTRTRTRRRLTMARSGRRSSPRSRGRPRRAGYWRGNGAVPWLPGLRMRFVRRARARARPTMPR